MEPIDPIIQQSIIPFSSDDRGDAHPPFGSSDFHLISCRHVNVANGRHDSPYRRVRGA